MFNIENSFKKQQKFFFNRKSRDLDFRLNALKKLKEIILKNESEILKALELDLGKSNFEGYLTEIGTILDEINYVIKKLKKWCRPKKVKTHYIHFLSKSYIYKEPYGVCLIISPWNYPFQLAMMPLIGAIAAGNCAIIKPSEYSIETSKIIYKIIKENFNEDYICVILGGINESKELLNQNFDHIFFTGSPNVGKIIMESAAKKLIPVVLELGGKSPCIVDESSNIKYAAKRIIWGKFLNAGQTCVAPDYLIVHKKVKEALIKHMISCIREFYGENPLHCEDFPKIINEKHFNRLTCLLNEGNILVGGTYDKDSLKIAPTIVEDITLNNSIMKEEIFGPILPVIEYEDLQEVVNIVKLNPKPLALYMFSTDSNNIKAITENISFGGGCINDTIMHLSTPYLPFGGVGNSGIGFYHGKNSFDAFSHSKSILKQTNLFDFPIRYPPYKDKLALIKKLLK